MSSRSVIYSWSITTLLFLVFSVQTIVSQVIPPSQVPFEQTFRIYYDYKSEEYSDMFTIDTNYKCPVAAYRGHDLYFFSYFGYKNNKVLGSFTTIYDNDCIVGLAAFDDDGEKKFELENEFSGNSYWVDNLIDINGDHSKEIIISTDFPNLNVYDLHFNYLRSFAIQPSTKSESPMIDDVDLDGNMDFAVIQNYFGYTALYFSFYKWSSNTFVRFNSFDSLVTRYYIPKDSSSSDYIVRDTTLHIFEAGVGGNIVAGDLKGENNKQVVVGGGGKVFVFEKFNTGYEQITSENFESSNSDNIVITNDMDGNGRDEIITVGNFDGAPLYWFEYDSTNTLKVKHKILIDISPFSISAFHLKKCDPDLDGIDDLAFIGTENIWILKWNRTTGQFEVYYYIDIDYFLQKLNVVREKEIFSGLDFYDMDEDGDNDMFISISNDYSSGVNASLLCKSTKIVTGLSENSNTLNNIKLQLQQNYPNPFNPSTAIHYSLPVRQAGVPAVDALSSAEVHVSLIVYDILGNEITTLVNENQSAGNYEVTFNASGLASGVYIYRLQTSSGFVSTKKLMLMK